MKIIHGPGIKLKMGGTGIVTPHPDDMSEAAEAIRRTLEKPDSTQDSLTTKAG